METVQDTRVDDHPSDSQSGRGWGKVGAPLEGAAAAGGSLYVAPAVSATTTKNCWKKIKISEGFEPGANFRTSAPAPPWPLTQAARGNDFRFFARLRPSNFFVVSVSDPIDGLQLSASSAHSFDSIEPIGGCCRPQIATGIAHFAAIFRTKSVSDQIQILLFLESTKMTSF